MKHAPTRPAAPDPTVYPVEDEVGEEIIQRWICEELRPLLQRFLEERGERAFVGADQFIYWKQYEPTSTVSPDIYVMPGIDPDVPVKCWKLWETGIVPSFALEVVAEDRRKDYERSPARHEELGTRELVIFDPHSEEGRDRMRWQVYRRAKRGLVQTTRTDADRIRSRALDCHLRVHGTGSALRLRIAIGARGEELYPTDAERAEHEKQRAEHEKQRADEAEAELARLAAEIEALRSRR